MSMLPARTEFAARRYQRWSAILHTAARINTILGLPCVRLEADEPEIYDGLGWAEILLRERFNEIFTSSASARNERSHADELHRLLWARAAIMRCRLLAEGDSIVQEERSVTTNLATIADEQALIFAIFEAEAIAVEGWAALRDTRVVATSGGECTPHLVIAMRKDATLVVRDGTDRLREAEAYSLKLIAD